MFLLPQKNIFSIPYSFIFCKETKGEYSSQIDTLYNKILFVCILKTCLSILVFLKDIQGKSWLYDQLVQYFINFSRLFWINRVKLKGTDPVTCSMSVCFEEICCCFLGSTIGFFHTQTG